jgi:hypothetical protein
MKEKNIKIIRTKIQSLETDDKEKIKEFADILNAQLTEGKTVALAEDQRKFLGKE